jgi:hypothetical protein
VILYGRDVYAAARVAQIMLYAGVKDPSAAHRTLYSTAVRSPPHWYRYSPRPGYGSADRAAWGAPKLYLLSHIPGAGYIDTNEVESEPLWNKVSVQHDLRHTRRGVNVATVEDHRGVMADAVLRQHRLQLRS